jgi:hypothetical protein
VDNSPDELRGFRQDGLVDGQNQPDDRFRDPLLQLRDFADEILVRCPACDECAVVLAHLETPQPRRTTKRSLRCHACGHSADAYPTVESRGGPTDPYFHQPLWLQTDCRGELLWAYNAEHLELLESYVGARLRERGLDRRWSSMLERLPTWIKSAKNRDDVLRSIRRLQTLETQTARHPREGGEQQGGTTWRQRP